MVGCSANTGKGLCTWDGGVNGRRHLSGPMWTDTPHTSVFSCSLHNSFHAYHTAWLKTSHPMCLCSAHSFHPHAIHDMCLIVCCLRPRSVLLLFSPSFTSSLPYPTCTLTSTSSSMSMSSRELIPAPSHNEEYCLLATYHPLTTEEDWIIMRLTEM